MRITCPSCAATYEVPEDRLAGRTVKCVRCGHDWQPLALAPPPVEPEPTPPELPPRAVPALPPPMAAVAEFRVLPAKPANRRAPLVAAWVLSLVVLAGLGAAAVLYRGAVMQAWPPSQRAYEALGLH